MKTIILNELTIDDFKVIISEVIKSEVDKAVTDLPGHKDDEFISRKELSKRLGISLPTLHQYVNKTY